MNVEQIMLEIESVGTERCRKTYKNQGAHEPVFGVAIKDLKPIAKKIGKNQALACQLYATGNYDAMYLAGMIAEPTKMDENDFEKWMEGAYFYMISDYIVAVVLAESDLAFKLAKKWIDSKEELYASAGWSTYTWLLGVKKDEAFNKEELQSLLETVKNEINHAADREKYAMNNFLTAVGISYVPLHKEALELAKAIGKIEINMGKTSCKVPVAFDAIQKAVGQGRLGFKRRNVRC